MANNMANDIEQQIIKYGLESGKSRDQIKEAVANYRLGITPEKKTGKSVQPVQDKQEMPSAMGRFAEAGEDIAQTFDAVKNTLIEGYKKVAETAPQLGKQNVDPARGTYRALGAGAQTVSNIFGDAVIGLGKVIYSQQDEDKIKKLTQEVMKPVLESPEVKGLISKYESLTPDQKKDLDAGLGIVSLALDLAGGEIVGQGVKATNKALNITRKAIKESVDGAKMAIQSGAKAVAESSIPKGIGQMGSEIIERIPRATERAGEAIEKSALKAERIKGATPGVANAIRNDVDDVLIEGLQKADKATLKSVKETIELAEQPKKLGSRTQPSYVSGKLATDQYDLIEAKRVAVGKDLEKAIDQLSKTQKIEMNEAYNKMAAVVADLDMGAYSPAQRAKIAELLKLATEGGDTLTPRQIYNKDRLFSQLKRETSLGEVGDIMVNVDGKQKSLFQVFKDVYADTLDEVSPANIRAINKEYRKYRTMVDAIEDTILRGGKNIEGISTINKNPAEFAKINLRRIFGEAGSSSEFEQVAKEMDRLARELGYEGGNPVVVADFAQKLRKLYPEITPQTGFEGLTKGSGGPFDRLAEFTLKVGQPNTENQRKALKELIDSLIE